MLSSFGRPKNHKHLPVSFDNRGQVIALKGRHVSRTATGAIVIAHARPFVGPGRVATFADVIVEEPSHLRCLTFEDDNNHEKRIRDIHDLVRTGVVVESSA